MGQIQCCEGEDANRQLIMNFNNATTQDPIETSVPDRLKKSIPGPPLISRRGFQDGIDGDYTYQQPYITKQVQDRLKTLHPIDIHQFTIRGDQTRTYFKSRRTGVIYHGQWNKKAQVPCGLGKNFYPNGGMYEGGFVDGIPHEFGRFIMANGDYYQGEVKFGRANGHGIFESEQSKYKGEFKDNVRHGKGEQKSKNFYFKGEYEYGEKKCGLLNYHGNTYEGEFLDGQFSGQGVLTTKEGVYTGNFNGGLQEGYGQFKWVDGSSYRGQYRKGFREGFGEYFDGKNSSISKGKWVNGKLNGQGQYIEPRGETHKVIWNQGRISGILDK